MYALYVNKVECFAAVRTYSWRTVWRSVSGKWTGLFSVLLLSSPTACPPGSLLLALNYACAPDPDPLQTSLMSSVKLRFLPTPLALLHK